MKEKKIGDVTIECLSGDITKQREFDAVVNAANAQLMPGGGVAGAIHRTAGRGLAEECKPLAPILPGQVVITSGHGLPNPHVIHCLGPIYGQDEPSDELLADCYRNALELADRHELRSVAFPAISTGAFGYPVEEAAPIALKTVAKTASKLRHVRRIRFCLFAKRDVEVHEEALDEIAGENG